MIHRLIRVALLASIALKAMAAAATDRPPDPAEFRVREVDITLDEYMGALHRPLAQMNFIWEPVGEHPRWKAEAFCGVPVELKLRSSLLDGPKKRTEQGDTVERGSGQIIWSTTAGADVKWPTVFARPRASIEVAQPSDLMEANLAATWKSIKHELRHLWQGMYSPEGRYDRDLDLMRSWLGGPLREKYAADLVVPEEESSDFDLGSEILKRLPKSLQALYQAPIFPHRRAGARLLMEIDAYASADVYGREEQFAKIRDNVAKGRRRWWNLFLAQRKLGKMDGYENLLGCLARRSAARIARQVAKEGRETNLRRSLRQAARKRPFARSDLASHLPAE